MVNDKTVMAIIRAARPSFHNNDDKIAFAVHASGYVLTATGPAAFSDTALSSPSTDEVGMDNWQELDDEYAFIYTNP
jgi:proteasome inhibitor subunit 1 (PI31)